LLKSKFLLVGLVSNLVAAFFMFGMGSVIPYLQLYTYRMNLASGDFQHIYSMDSAVMRIKTSASPYICKDIAKRVPIHFEKPVSFEPITRYCSAVFNERDDSITYALLGRLNAVAWINTKDSEYFFKAERYFRLSSIASIHNESARLIVAEGRLYLHGNLER